MLTRRERRRVSRLGLKRALVRVLSIAAILLPAAGIAYLGAVSYQEDRGLVAARLAEQYRAAVSSASALEAEIERTLDQVAAALAVDSPGPETIAELVAGHALAAFPFRIAPDGSLVYPALEPLRSPVSAGGDFLARAPTTCPERGFDACIRAIRAARRRAQRLEGARRRELSSCARSWQKTGEKTPCLASARDREVARRAYTALARFEDTAPQALLGLARLAVAAGDAEAARGHYQAVSQRFASRLDTAGVSYRLLADMGAAEVNGSPASLLEVYRRVLERTYEAPGAMLEDIAETLRTRLERADLAPADSSRCRKLGAALQFARDQARFSRALVGEVDEIERTAGPRTRGRAALTAPERTLIYRRQREGQPASGQRGPIAGSIVGILVDNVMLEAEAARGAAALRRLPPWTRAVVERPGDAAPREKRARTLASTGFGAILPHLSLAVVNDRRMPDPLDEIVEARGRRHLAITGGLVALLVIGLLATIRGAARERELSRLKSDFVSTVSHELKTPLTSIRMFGEMLQQGVAGSDRQREARYHDIIVKESQRLGLLIANLLDYSQIERGTRRYSRKPQDAADIARDAIATFQRFRDHPADIRLSVTDARSPSGESEDLGKILADRDVITQCLLNLLGNAIKYGKPPIEVRVTTGERVTLAVADHGPGIPTAEHERIFREFYRASAAHSSGVEGTGLGLALVKRHVEAQGGEVAVTSEPGRGAVFTISFPICRKP